MTRRGPTASFILVASIALLGCAATGEADGTPWRAPGDDVTAFVGGTDAFYGLDALLMGPEVISGVFFERPPPPPGPSPPPPPR